MKHGLSAACGLTILLAVSLPAQAEPALNCHASATHVVIEREREDSAGQDFLAKAKASPDAKIPCAYQVAKGDYEIDGSEDEYFFLGLQDHFLLLDGGTGSVRSLVVHDLNTRKKVFEASTSGEDTQVTGQGVTFWMQTGEGNAKNCKPFKQFSKSGLGAAIETRVTFDFASLQLQKSAQTHCVATQ